MKRIIFEICIGLIAGFMFILFYLFLKVPLIPTIGITLAGFIGLSLMVKPSEKTLKIKSKGFTVEEFNTIIKEGRSKVKDIREKGNLIGNHEVRDNINKICDVAEEIFIDFIKDPKDIGVGRKFIDYYLNTTQRIVEMYYELSRKMVYSENEERILDKAEKILIQIETTFHKQLGKLQEDDYLDLDKKILKKDYGIVVQDKKSGSYEMLDADLRGIDFLFPSSQVALEMFKESRSNNIKATERIFQSPIVFYSWRDIGEALVKKGIAKHIDGEHYTLNLIRFIEEIIIPGKKWSDIGLDLYGNAKIISTDPNKSNSGNMYAGLLYRILADKGYSSEEAIGKIKEMFKSMGFTEASSATLFESYLIKGKGANPIIVGYENQIVEFALQNPDVWNKAKGNVVVLVPEPTVWSEHPIIALTENAKLLIEALTDEAIRKIAWEKHGFRYPAFQNRDKTVVTLPKTLDKIIEMPSVKDMKNIMNKLLQ